MENKKILFLDIDNTLLTTKKELTPEVDRALHAALDKGHKIVITTGRPQAAIGQYLDLLNLRSEGCYAICYNGAVIWDCHLEKIVHSFSLSIEDAKYLFRRANEEGFHVQTYDSRALLSQKDSRELRYYQKVIQMDQRIDPALPETLTEEPAKVLMIDLDDHDRIERFRQSLSEWTKGRISCFFSNPYYLEFVKEGISKGSAVSILADMLDIPMENTVAAGDSENDIPMIKAAKIGCAMANASDEVKAAADYVTKRSCDESGVAEIVEKFIL